MTRPLLQILPDFLDFMRLDRGSSDHTVASYRRDLTQLAEWLSTHNSPSPPQLEDLNRFIASLHHKKQKASSIARKVSAFRQFFKFCVAEEGWELNPSEQLRTPALSQRLPQYLSEPEITALLTAAAQGLPYRENAAPALQARDRAMVCLIYATGLRVSELVGLSLHEVDLGLGYVRVKGKGDKERIVPFAPIAGTELETYLTQFRPTLTPATDHVFVNQRGFALTRQSFWKLLGQLAVQAGISAPISPHTLRHSFATHLLQSGMGLRSLQMLLGHSDLSTTQIYAHISPAHLKSAHRKFHPRGGD
jgi:integrase/recombinase XerD